MRPDSPFLRARLSRRALHQGLAAAALGSLVGCRASRPTAPAAPLGPYPGHTVPLLVDANWLQAAREQQGDNIVVVDVSDLPDYRRGHIPGAVHGWWRDTVEVDYPVYGATLLPDDAGVQTSRIELLNDVGISPDTSVVFYGDDRNRWAARMVWFLRFLGHDRAAMLDGGLAAWLGAGGETADDDVTPGDGQTRSLTPRDGYHVWTEPLIAKRADPETILLDARTEDEARDTVNGLYPLGRIPGSVAVPWTATLRDDLGRFKDADELSAIFAGTGVTPDRDVVVYTRFGVEAAHPWLVLKLLGYPRVVIYDRGWAEWSTTPGLPTEPLT